MKYLFILLVLLFTGCTKDIATPQQKFFKARFQSVTDKQAIIVQKGKDRFSCTICGMHLPTFYETNHAAITKENHVRQYCSLHCIVHDNEINKIDLYDVKVVDVTTLKFISAQSAYYVVGSKVEKKKDGLRKSVDLQTDCMFIHGALESPGIAQIVDNKLILTPLIRDQVVIPLSDIDKIEERHWYSGSQYWGNNIYFKLNVRDKESRIGFAVSRPDTWREAFKQIEKL